MALHAHRPAWTSTTSRRRPPTGRSRPGTSSSPRVDAALGSVAGQRARAQRAAGAFGIGAAGGDFAFGRADTCPARPRCWARSRRAATPWSGSTTRSPPTRSSSTSPGRAVEAPGADRALVRRRRRPSPVRACGRARARRVRRSRSSPGPRAPGEPGGAGHRAGGRRRGPAGLRLPPDPRRRRLVARPPRRPGRGESLAAHLHRRPRRRLRPGAGRRLGRGEGAHSEILSAYLGDGTQVHDIRTLQDHVAPRTTSELLCQGAVAGTSRRSTAG